MARLDLDARRAEATDEPHELVLGGRTFALPARMSIAFGALLAEGDFFAAFAALMGSEEEADTLLAAGLTDEELTVIVSDLYGITPGESSASSASSNRATRRSRRTSNGSTRPT